MQHIGKAIATTIGLLSVYLFYSYTNAGATFALLWLTWMNNLLVATQQPIEARPREE